MPDWYPVLKAAEAFHVAPWELLEHHEWIDLLYAARDAEKRAEKFKKG